MMTLNSYPTVSTNSGKRKIPPKMAAASSKKAKKTFTVNSTVETLRASKNSRKTRKTRGRLKKDRKWKL